MLTWGFYSCIPAEYCRADIYMNILILFDITRVSEGFYTQPLLDRLYALLLLILRSRGVGSEKAVLPVVVGE